MYSPRRESSILTTEGKFCTQHGWEVLYSPRRGSYVLTTEGKFCTHHGGEVLYSPRRGSSVLTTEGKFCTHHGGAVLYSPRWGSSVLTTEEKFCTHYGGEVLYSPRRGSSVLTTEGKFCASPVMSRSASSGSACMTRCAACRLSSCSCHTFSGAMSAEEATRWRWKALRLEESSGWRSLTSHTDGQRGLAYTLTVARTAI